MGKQNRIRSKRQKLDPKKLSCITLSHGATSFVALLDSGSNCNIVGMPLLEKLKLTDQVIYKKYPVSSFTGEITTFIGIIYFTFSIGSQHYRQKFYVQDRLSTNTDALLGTIFLSAAGVEIKYDKTGREISIKGFPVEIVEQQKRISQDGKVLLVTYVATDDQNSVRKIAKSCDYKRIDPLTAVVVKASLPGSNYPEQVSTNRVENSGGILVESQLITTRRHEPRPGAKCNLDCTQQNCAHNCPRVHYWFAYMLVHNATNRPIYLRPGQGLAEIECQYENKSLAKIVNTAMNKGLNKLQDSIGQDVTKKLQQAQAKKIQKEKNIKKEKNSKIG